MNHSTNRTDNSTSIWALNSNWNSNEGSDLPSDLNRTLRSLYIDQISLDYFVCAPRAFDWLTNSILAELNSSRLPRAFKVERLSPTIPTANGDISSLSGDSSGIQESDIKPHDWQPPIRLILDYLKSSLIDSQTNFGHSESVKSETLDTQMAGQQNGTNFVVNATQGE